jgi:hypothetical protein
MKSSRGGGMSKGGGSRSGGIKSGGGFKSGGGIKIGGGSKSSSGGSFKFGAKTPSTGGLKSPSEAGGMMKEPPVWQRRFGRRGGCVGGFIVLVLVLLCIGAIAAMIVFAPILQAAVGG